MTQNSSAEGYIATVGFSVAEVQTCIVQEYVCIYVHVQGHVYI